MASKSDGGFWDGFFGWEIWGPLGEVWTNASQEHPTFVFVALTSTILILAGAAFGTYIIRSRQEHEHRSRQQFIEMQRSNDAKRDHYIRLIVKKIPPETLSRLIQEDRQIRDVIDHEQKESK